VFPFDFGFIPGTHGADGEARCVWFRRGSSG
jgi:hypothetical protein